MIFDVLIAGAGISGAAAARRLAELGHKILVVEQRNHIGGNCFDCHDQHGILIHQYGPHIFHTNQLMVWEFVSRFTSWILYQHNVLAHVDGLLVPIPINLKTIELLYNRKFTPEQMEIFLAELAEDCAEPQNSRDSVVSKVGRQLYQKLFKNYTLKQWGVSAKSLAPEVCARIPVRTNNDCRYFTDTYQGMPTEGYTKMISAMLNHNNIHVMTQTDFHSIRENFPVITTIYTGPIDAYFNHSLGPLPYRSIHFDFKHHECDSFQQCSVVNYPNDYDFTRITEYKKLTGQRISGTTISKEYPIDAASAGEGAVPCYPMPTAEAQTLYRQYEELAAREDKLFFLGRLGRYRYLNMDQAVLEGLQLAEKIG